MPLPPTLRFANSRIEFLDQRVLPHRVEFVACDSAAATADAIRTMVVRGAPAIGCAAAYGVAVEAARLADSPTSFEHGLHAGFAVLAASRPTAVNLFWALERMQRLWDSLRALNTPPTVVAGLLLDEAHLITEDDVAINKRMGAHGAALVPDGARILTHCNAGALATAGHGTALGVIRSARDMGKKISVWVDETRPLLQGARLTAWELVQEGISATLITDNMSGSMMARGLVDLVIIGADRVAANGDAANKIGTYMVAVLAKRHNVPFYVACPQSTIDRAMPSGDHIVIEERAGNEVTGYGDLRWAADGVNVANPAFDVTPAELISGIITEEGVWHVAP